MHGGFGPIRRLVRCFDGNLPFLLTFRDKFVFFSLNSFKFREKSRNIEKIKTYCESDVIACVEAAKKIFKLL